MDTHILIQCTFFELYSFHHHLSWNHHIHIISTIAFCNAASDLFFKSHTWNNSLLSNILTCWNIFLVSFKCQFSLYQMNFPSNKPFSTIFVTKRNRWMLRRRPRRKICLMTVSSKKYLESESVMCVFGFTWEEVESLSAQVFKLFL